MLSHKRYFALAVVLAVLGVIVAACATPAPVEIIKTVIVTEEVMVEGTPVIKEVVKEVVVTATPAPVEPPKDPDAPKEAGKGDVVRMAILSDMTTMNFWSAYGPINSSMWNYVVMNLYYPTAYNTGAAHRWDYVPFLAKDMASTLEQEGDFWVSTVPLRDDAVWSDGNKITAHDWAWTVNVVLKLNLQGNWTNYDTAYLERIEAVDDFTAKIYYHTKPGLAVHEYGTLGAPWMSQAFWADKVDPLVARMEAEGAGLDKESDKYISLQTEIVQELETLDPTGEPSGGSWVFGQWEQGAFVENLRHENYFDSMREVTEYVGGGYKEVVNGMEWSSGDTSAEVQTEYTEGPWFDKVLYTLYNADAAVLALDAGEVDFIITPNGLSRGQVAQLQPNPNISISQNPANGFRYLTFNFAVPILREKALRQATACMIDKQFLTQNVLQGAAIPVNTIVPEANAYWYNPDVPLFCEGMDARGRMEEAVRLLKEAGFTWDAEPYWIEERGGSVEWGSGLKGPDGQYVPALRLLAPSAGYDPLRATAGVYIEQWMSQLGIPVKAELTNFNRILEVRTDPEAWDMYILGWGLTTFPDSGCRFLMSDAGWNFGAYNNAEFDGVCNELLAATEREVAREYAFEMQEILADELPYLYLFTTPMFDAWNNANIMYPFTDVIDGIGSGWYGLPDYVMAVQE
jgi:peptide/nickel transport system substrate-binding protein